MHGIFTIYSCIGHRGSHLASFELLECLCCCWSFMREHTYTPDWVFKISTSMLFGTTLNRTGSGMACLRTSHWFPCQGMCSAKQLWLGKWPRNGWLSWQTAPFVLNSNVQCVLKMPGQPALQTLSFLNKILCLPSICSMFFFLTANHVCNSSWHVLVGYGWVTLLRCQRPLKIVL